jgi:Tfp pilus assembly protein FimV
MTTLTAPTAAPVSARPSASAGRLRLTRRGRVVVVLGLLLAVLVVGFALGHVSHAPAAEPGATRILVVQPGDTLWSIAARVEPSQDTRRVVAQLTTMNGLHGASVQVGERLTVPV